MRINGSGYDAWVSQAVRFTSNVRHALHDDVTCQLDDATTRGSSSSKEVPHLQIKPEPPIGLEAEAYRSLLGQHQVRMEQNTE